MNPRNLFLLLLVLAAVSSASAQIDVDIAFKRAIYIRYEPIICVVTITNRTGNELDLRDSRVNKWFSFQIERAVEGNPIPPINPNYSNEPVQIGPGQTLKRSINITPLYPLDEFGTYRVRATIFSEQLNKFFASQPLNVEITEGRLLWQQVVGIPDGSGFAGKTRKISFLAHRLPRTTMLYIRIEDTDSGIVYCTHQLGRFVDFGESNVMLDSENQVHVLQNSAPKAFFYTILDLDGKVLKRVAYMDEGSRPIMGRRPDGTVAIAGGTIYDPNAPKPIEKLPTLSDRPIPVPTPQGEKKSEYVTPENLLSR